MMKRLVFLSLFLSLPAVAADGAMKRELVANDSGDGVYGTGVNGENLADTPETDWIDMGKIRNQLSLTLAVTPGTTASFTVKCYESETKSNIDTAEIPFCTSAASATCEPDVRTYTIADWETIGGAKVIPSSWPVRKRFVKCKLDDAADGTGTIVVTGTVSWQG